MPVEDSNFDMARNIQDKTILLLDIEGTTTSISFVKDVLFPYARNHVSSYFLKTIKDPATTEVIEELIKQAETDKNNGIENIKPIPTMKGDENKQDVIDALVDYVHTLIDADRKVKPLKTLQGYIWQEAYLNGSIKGHIYDDVIPLLKNWISDEKRKVYIYSSGSVKAQKLLFEHSIDGNILQYFSGHFDTSVGAKIEAQSYKTILKQIGSSSDAGKVIFITDLPKEAYAAKEAGIYCILSKRPGTIPLTDDDEKTFPVISSFDELPIKRTPAEEKRCLEKSESSCLTEDKNKRKKLC